MKIKVNGELKSLKTDPVKSSLRSVIEELGYQSHQVVVEHNGLIVPSDNWTSQLIEDGDNLEIVTIVGGGS